MTSSFDSGRSPTPKAPRFEPKASLPPASLEPRTVRGEPEGIGADFAGSTPLTRGSLIVFSALPCRLSEE